MKSPVMKMCSCVLVMMALATQILMVFADGDSLPSWKTQMMHFHKWDGYFEFQGQLHHCEMVVHSVQKDDNGGAFVSFTAENIKLDMAAYSEDGISIIFKKEAIYQPGDHFYDNFQFVVELLQYRNTHALVGNITHPASNSSSIRLRPEGKWVTNHMKSSDLSIGLAVGISLFLFIVCAVIGIVFLRWAIRKGYLRHVAMSYKNFRNPDLATEPHVSFSNTPPESRPEEVNVHI